MYSDSAVFVRVLMLPGAAVQTYSTKYFLMLSCFIRTKKTAHQVWYDDFSTASHVLSYADHAELVWSCLLLCNSNNSKFKDDEIVGIIQYIMITNA